jgi:hypothetical protein
MSSVTQGMESAFLISRQTMPASPRAALKQLQPRVEQKRVQLAQTLRSLARELEHEANEVMRGEIRPAHQMVGPYASMLDKLRAEANLLREWTQQLRDEIGGPVTPYLGTPVIPPPAREPAPAPAPLPARPEQSSSIAALMDEVASASQL